MKNLPLLMCTAFCGLNAVQADAADNKKNERPNILWLTFEDTSAYEFGCYGNKGVHTPNADSLAVHGIQFMNAWSVAPQSSAARSSLITPQATEWMSIRFHTTLRKTYSSLNGYGKPDIIALTTAKRITTPPQTIKVVGTNVPLKHPTTVLNAVKTNHSSLCITQ